MVRSAISLTPHTPSAFSVLMFNECLCEAVTVFGSLRLVAMTSHDNKESIMGSLKEQGSHTDLEHSAMLAAYAESTSFE